MGLEFRTQGYPLTVYRNHLVDMVFSKLKDGCQNYHVHGRVHVHARVDVNVHVGVHVRAQHVKVHACLDAHLRVHAHAHVYPWGVRGADGSAGWVGLTGPSRPT